MASEIDCDMCGGHAEGNNCKQVCIHCFNSEVKKVRRLMKENDKLRKKLKNATGDKNKMDDSEKLYHLSAEMGSIIYRLGLNGWATELDITNNKTKEEAKIKVKIDVKRHKPKQVGKKK